MWGSFGGFDSCRRHSVQTQRQGSHMEIAFAIWRLQKATGIPASLSALILVEIGILNAVINRTRQSVLHHSTLLLQTLHD